MGTPGACLGNFDLGVWSCLLVSLFLCAVSQAWCLQPAKSYVVLLLVPPVVTRVASEQLAM
ncbi:hypothetical protein LZ31DRAFT_559691 [Colletotrichum somersetense]|nr:hypothetical protein LZ31DRAFT_559691 [Colletotrichum somersetense]